MISSSPTPPWISSNSALAMSILETAKENRQPVVLLLGAGVSINAGIPLASQLKEYLTQMHQLVRDKGFSNARQYVEEARWPSRHDLRVELMLRKKTRSLVDVMPTAERLATQAAMISEIRREAPMLASSLQEIFGQLDEEAYNQPDLQKLYMDVVGLARSLGRRSPQNVAYRSLLFHLCDRNQTTIDACLDHFIRDRVPDTTHQFIFFLTQLLNCRVILTTNFDPLLEVAFTGEGLLPRVYEVHGEGSIPSGQLLLSQPLSIVKLHGGAHQLQTGFDLDDPLSPAALSTFADLFRRLTEQASGQPPLIIAIGYSGSDRRVMDIITNQIREWRSKKDEDNREEADQKEQDQKEQDQKKQDQKEQVQKKNLNKNNNTGYQPRVLWVNRDPWVPDLLKAAVRTHPEVMQHGDSAKNPELYPAHVVRYREGRMFLFEAIQRLKGHFPIARSHYQGVNFVQHSTESRNSKESQSPTLSVLKELKGQWRLALIHSSKSGEGSSTALVALADELEQNEGARTIWIDLSEVAGVAALFDVLSERLVKLDSRLHAIRRPPVMQWLIDPKRNLDETPALTRSCTHELRTMAQWLRQALRRGRYLLALDSVDEFPSCHPGLVGKDLFSDEFEKTQRQLFLKLFQELLEHPSLLGDSRIALAVSPDSGSNTENPTEKAEPEEVREQRDGKSETETEGQTGKSESRKESGHQDVKGEPEAEVPLRRLIKDFVRFHVGHLEIRYANSHGIEDYVPVVRQKVEEVFHEQFRAKEELDRPLAGLELDRPLAGLVVLVSVCARRVRSEVMLLRCVSEFIGRLLHDENRDPGNQSLEKLEKELRKLICGPDMIRKIGRRLESPCRKPSIWQEYSLGGQHKTDLGFPQFNDQILKAIRAVAHYGQSSAKFEWGTPRRQWIYRTEGGYHWMHRDVRNGLYSYLKGTKENVGVLAAIHHTIALYSYDELYERSRDARSFLEYMFHRIAAIRFAVKANQMGCVCGWLYRLGLALHREKLALLTRARVPGLIHMIAQLIDIVKKETIENKNKEWVESGKKRNKLTLQIESYRNDLRSLMAVFLLASGYPHSAFDSLRRRVFRPGEVGKEHPVECEKILNEVRDNLKDILRPSYSPGTSNEPENEGKNEIQKYFEKNHEFIEKLRSFRDLAYACQDPLLSAVKFPTLGLKTKKQPDDWPDRYVEKLNEGDNSEIPGGKSPPDHASRHVDKPNDSSPKTPKDGRKTRLRICRTVYEKFISLSPDNTQTQFHLTGSDSDPEGDLFHSIIRRLLEFRLTQYPRAWVASAELYWDRTKTKSLDRTKPTVSDHSKYEQKLTKELIAKLSEEELDTNSALWIVRDLNPDTKPDLYQNAELLSGRLPVLRSSPRRRRNECHRLCLLARLKVAAEFSREDFKDKWEEITRPDEPWWKKILQNLEAAEAILSRNGDPADRQAMAITRLTMAELFLRRAEIRLLWDMKKTDDEKTTTQDAGSSADDDRVKNQRRAEETTTKGAPSSSDDNRGKKQRRAKEIRTRSLSDHDRCISLLSTVEGLLDDGRGENRWRFFYLLTRARSFMFYAFIRRENYRRQALNDLRWAARNLSGATSNCGLWTDRYDVLGWWWDTWQSLAKSFYPNEPDQFNQYLQEMKSLLGIRWHKENYARRDDRWKL